MTVPKYKRPAKTALGWPGKFKVDYSGSEKAQYPWKFQCQAPLCFYTIVAPTEEKIDQRAETHPCPWYGGGTTTLSWGTMSDNYLAPIWEMLDAEVDIVKADSAHTNSDTKFARQRALAYAEALAILMPPFFSTVDEIRNEAMVRWEHRQAETEYETPGLGRLKWKQPMPEQTLAFAKRVEFDPEQEPEHNLTEDEVTKIKASKMFPANMLAEAYSTTESVVKWLWKH